MDNRRSDQNEYSVSKTLGGVPVDLVYRYLLEAPGAGSADETGGTDVADRADRANGPVATDVANSADGADGPVGAGGANSADESGAANSAGGPVGTDGAVSADERRVRGDGWRATVKAVEPRRHPGLTISQVELTVAGRSDRVEQVMGFLMPRVLRGGA